MAFLAPSTLFIDIFTLSRNLKIKFMTKKSIHEIVDCQGLSPNAKKWAPSSFYCLVTLLSASDPELSRICWVWGTTESGICTKVISKVVLAWNGHVCFYPIEITATTSTGTVYMKRVASFLIPCCRSAIHTLISSNVDIFVRSTGLYFCGHVSDDVKVFKWGSQVICIYGAICVVSASSSPVSRMISEPKEVRSLNQVGLPIWIVTADGLVFVVKHDILLYSQWT